MRWNEMNYAGWGRVLSATGQLARPERARALADVMRETPAPAIGNGRSYGDAGLNTGGRAIRMTRLDRMTGFDAETGLLSIEAGVRIGEIAATMAPRGWLPPVMPGTGFATVGGCIAMDVHGKNHHGAGSFGEHVQSITLETPTGPRTARRGTALFEATVGGLGQTGAIVSAEIQLLACRGDVMIVTERRVETLDAHLALLDGSKATYTVGWIDATATGDALGRGIVEEGETGAGLTPRRGTPRRIPFDAPGFALSAPVVRVFNAAYWRRIPAAGRTVVKPISDFFFPLDKIHDWNRLYGRRGFYQFQCVLPLDARDTLREMLARIGRAGLASPLAVLKRMGPGGAGYLSFPMEGYTLAVDFPNRGPVTGLVAALEALTRAAGGRIYLAKDALADGESVRAMYPGLPRWAAIADEVDPERTLTTDLVRRLELRT